MMIKINACNAAQINVLIVRKTGVIFVQLLIIRIIRINASHVLATVNNALPTLTVQHALMDFTTSPAFSYANSSLHKWVLPLVMEVILVYAWEAANPVQVQTTAYLVALDFIWLNMTQLTAYSNVKLVILHVKPVKTNIIAYHAIMAFICKAILVKHALVIVWAAQLEVTVLSVSVDIIWIMEDALLVLKTVKNALVLLNAPNVQLASQLSIMSVLSASQVVVSVILLILPNAFRVLTDITKTQTAVFLAPQAVVNAHQLLFARNVILVIAFVIIAVILTAGFLV